MVIIIIIIYLLTILMVCIKYIVHKNTFNHRENCKLVRKVITEGTEKDSNKKFTSQREYTNKKKYRAIVLAFSSAVARSQKAL